MRCTLQAVKTWTTDLLLGTAKCLAQQWNVENLNTDVDKRIYKLCVKTQFGTSCSARQCSVPWSAGRNQGVTAIYHIHPPMNTLCSLNVVPRFCQISCLHFANSHSHPTNIRANLQQFKVQTAEQYCCSVWEVLPLKIAFQQVPKGQ